MRCLTLLPLLVTMACAAPVPGGDVQIIRIGTSGDYAPFSVSAADAAVEGAGGPEGFDPAVARAWAKARGFELRFVEFRWPDLLDSLAADHFDVAMSGITVRAERSLAGRFSVPVATSGAVVLTREASGATSVADLDRADVRIAVNAGGHLERVARATFQRARIIAVADNACVPEQLAKGHADAVMTDSREAPHWLAAQPGLRAIGPFTRDRKAYLLGPADRELAQDLDSWLMESEADGTLARLRVEHLGEHPAGAATAAALPAVLAAIDERLALMPLVAEAKRLTGAPIEVPEREATVLEAAVRGVIDAAQAREKASHAPDPAAVRRLFAAQIEAAKDIQRSTLARPAPKDAPPPPDLVHVLRPALIRIGQRITFLLLALPDALERSVFRAAARDELSQHGLSDDRVDEIADALHAVANRRGGGTPDKMTNR